MTMPVHLSVRLSVHLLPVAYVAAAYHSLYRDYPTNHHENSGQCWDCKSR